MARTIRNQDHGAYRAVATHTRADGTVYQEVQGPYATEAAAKARRVWLRREFKWRIEHHGGTVVVEVQTVADPTWVSIPGTGEL